MFEEGGLVLAKGGVGTGVMLKLEKPLYDEVARGGVRPPHATSWSCHQFHLKAASVTEFSERATQSLMMV